MLGEQLLARRLDAVAVLPQRQRIERLLDARADVLEAVEEERDHHACQMRSRAPATLSVAQRHSLTRQADVG